MKTNQRIWRRHLSAILVGVLAVGCSVCTPVSATDTFDPEDSVETETFPCGDFTYSILVGAESETEKAACVESYTGSATDVVIPSTMDGLPVVTLGDRAFAGDYDLTNVTLPKSLLSLGLYTFAECTALQSFTVPADSAYFESKDGVLYAEDGTYLVRYPIGREPVKVEIPDGVTEVGYVAFGYCRTITSVTFPDSLTALNAWAFTDCVSLNSITFPDTLTAIDEFAFYRCVALQSVTLPSALTTIGDGAFASTALSDLSIPRKCTTIGQAAFADTKLKSVTIPSTVVEIGFSAFGWKLNVDRELVAQPNFTIRGTAGSEAARYASDTENGNDFTFVADEATSTETTAASTALAEEQIGVTSASSATSTTAAKDLQSFQAAKSLWIVLGLFGLLFVAVLVVLIVFLSKRTKKHNPTSSTDATDSSDDSQKG